MYFAKRDGRYIDLSGRSFRDFMDGELAELPGERADLKDWADHLTTIFPEVRLKQYLEMRGADSGPWSRLCALPALWVGRALRRRGPGRRLGPLQGLDGRGPRAPARATSPASA